MDVKRLELDGSINLEPCVPARALDGEAKVEDGEPLFFVNLPFMAIKILNAALPPAQRVLPDELLRLPSQDFPWSWTDFEQLFGHLQAARMAGLREIRQASLTDLEMTKRSLENSDGTKSLEHAKSCVQHSLAALRAKKDSWRVDEIFPGAAGHSKLLKQSVVLSCQYTQHVERTQCLSQLQGQPEARQTTQCSDGTERELGAGVFACCAGTALIDHRFVCATPKAKPIKFMVQDKYSHIDSSGGSVKADLVVEWYQRTMAAFEKYEEHYMLVLIFFSNRRIVGHVSGCPQLLIVASKELPHYLGPDLVGRGLLRSLAGADVDNGALTEQYPPHLPPTPVKSASRPEEKEDGVKLLPRFNALALEDSCSCRRSCGNRCPCSDGGCTPACGCPMSCQNRQPIRKPL